MSTPVLIGYLARPTPRKPSRFLRAADVDEIACVDADVLQSVVRPQPESRSYKARDNALRHYDNEQIAWDVLRDSICINLHPDDSLDPPWRVDIQRPPKDMYDLYAYGLYPQRFVRGTAEQFSVPKVVVAPLPPDYERLGYDVAGWNQGRPFQCSPLICNAEAAHERVNSFCLFDEAGPAFELARRFSSGQCKSIWPVSGHCGSDTYCVIEVWRKRKPFREPARATTPFEWKPNLLQHLISQKMAHGGVWGP
jgi:hypothetical protein